MADIYEELWNVFFGMDKPKKNETITTCTGTGNELWVLTGDPCRPWVSNIPYCEDNVYDFFEIENVYPNEEKGAYCVKWADGDKTVIHLQAGDEWDEEKALALCFMKHLYGSSFNEITKEWCNHDEDES